MELYVALVFSIVIFAATLAAPSTKQYRTDYQYNTKTNAFYKLHIEIVKQDRAKAICGAEGAKLMVPASKVDIAQVHGMLKAFPDIGNYVWVDSDGESHESVEEQPIIDLSPQNGETTPRYTSRWSTSCDVITRDGEIESTSCWPRSLPFVCKVDAKDARYDPQCGTYGLQYTYISSARSCYKVPEIAYPWDSAYAFCRSEGSHLCVLNSEVEHEAVRDFLERAPRLRDAYVNYFYFAGIRANRPVDGTARVWRTVFNETLEEAGYSGWSYGEPNNHQNQEYCGTIFRTNGKYNDVNCINHYAFLCEKEVAQGS